MQLEDDVYRLAIKHLDDILERHTLAFVHLDRAGLVERLERIRECALAARMGLAENRPFPLDPGT